MPNLITHACGTHATALNAMGMREMQARAYDSRNAQYLLIKAPPASGKSRALMYIGLDKIATQGLRKIIVAVPERSIGNSFKTTILKPSGFFADWLVAPKYNLTTAGGGRKTEAVANFSARKKPFSFVRTRPYDSPMKNLERLPSLNASSPSTSFTILLPMRNRNSANWSEALSPTRVLMSSR